MKVLLASLSKYKFFKIYIFSQTYFMRISVIRKSHFNAAHRLYNPSWSDKKNQSIFGPCNNANYHGHNYELEVKVTGEIDQNTGYVYDMKRLADLIKTEIEDRFDHKNLNLDVPEMSGLIPSAENISIVIYNLLRQRIDIAYDIAIKLWETPRNCVEYPA